MGCSSLLHPAIPSIQIRSASWAFAKWSWGAKRIALYINTAWAFRSAFNLGLTIGLPEIWGDVWTQDLAEPPFMHFSSTASAVAELGAGVAAEVRREQQITDLYCYVFVCALGVTKLLKPEAWGVSADPVQNLLHEKVELSLYTVIIP